MAFDFNLDEVLAMAEQVERNGARFYTRAAHQANDPQTKQLFMELARWENSHEALFSSLRKEFAGLEQHSPTFDPDGEQELYLEAMADQHVFNTNTSPEDLISEDITPMFALRTALQFEADSILFFMGMKRMVPERLGRAKIDHLIDEEFGHVAILKRQLKKLEG